MVQSYAYELWPIVVINAGIFIFFALSFLKPKGQREWISLGTFSAFVVALFTEMYGFPLTIYILSSILGSKYPSIDPFSHTNGHLWVVLSGSSTWVFTLTHLLSNSAMLGGLIVLGAAWSQIHRAKGGLVTSGLYGWVRHPQYSGLFLITTGMLIQWPTIVTVAMWPILMFMYYRLARREEKEMEDRFGDEYITYKRKVPMFLPRLVPMVHGAKA